jgi:hypothetical protein
MDVLQEVKLRLGLKNDDTKDDILNSFINQIEIKIKNYCNITTVPAGLMFVWVAMVVDLYNVTVPSAANVQEIKRGDTTIKYASKADEFIDKVVIDHSRELNRYRKVRVL